MIFEDKREFTNGNENFDPMEKMSSNYVMGRNSVTYPNQLKNNKMQTQNYLDMNDIVVPIIIKKGDDGQIYFAMEYIYIPAKNQIFIELPSIGMQEKKEEYSDLDILTATTNLTDMLQLSQSNGKINDLASNYDPVSASFTNQMVKFVELGVKNQDGDKRLHWFPVSCLQDLLSKEIPMSLQTKYALLLFEQKHKKEISSITPTEAQIDKELLNLTQKFREENKEDIIWPHKKRFGVAKRKIPAEIQELMAEGRIDYVADNFEEKSDGISNEESVYGMSKNSVQCIVARIKDGKVQVCLQPQLRSPFIAKNKVDSYFLETPAGGIEEEDYQNIDINSDEYKNLNQATKEIVDYYAAENAATRESAEEGGFKISSDNLIKLSQDLLYSQGTEEMTGFYLAIIPSDYEKGKRNLDEQEVILSEDEDSIWYDLDGLDINKLHSPISKKMLLILTKKYFDNQKNKEQEIEIDAK